MGVFRDPFHGLDDIRHIRVFGLAEWGRNADADGIEGTDFAVIGGGDELAGFDQRREAL